MKAASAKPSGVSVLNFRTNRFSVSVSGLLIESQPECVSEGPVLLRPRCASLADAAGDQTNESTSR